MSNYEIPYWKKYTLSIEEAAAYFRIGEGKLRRLVQENPRADYLLWNGNRVQIKREKFEAFVDTLRRCRIIVTRRNLSVIISEKRLKFWMNGAMIKKKLPFW